MTQEEKYTAIMERSGKDSNTITPLELSVMMVIKYLIALQDKGLVEIPFKFQENGMKFMSIAEEFAWSPTNDDINLIVNNFFPLDDREMVSTLIRTYRDNPNELDKYLEAIKNKQN